MRRRNETFREIMGGRIHSFGPGVNRKVHSLKSILSAELTQQTILELLTGHGIFVRMGGIRIKLQSGHSDAIPENRRQVCPGIQIPFPALLLGKIPYTNYLPGTPGPDWKLSSVSEGAKCFGVWGNGCGKWYSARWAAKRAFLRDAQWQQKYRRPNPEKNFFGMCETKSLADEGFPHSFLLINYKGFLLWGFSGFITGNPKTMWQHNGALKSQVRSLIGWDVMFWERVSNETNILAMK